MFGSRNGAGCWISQHHRHDNTAVLVDKVAARLLDTKRHDAERLDRMFEIHSYEVLDPTSSELE